MESKRNILSFLYKKVLKEERLLEKKETPLGINLNTHLTIY